MKLIHFLAERIEQTLYLDAVNALDDVLREKGADWVTQIKRMTAWDEFKAAETAAYDEDDNDLADKLRTRWYDRYSELMSTAHRHKNGVYDGLMKSFKDALEVRLQTVARDYIESKLGKIEPYVHNAKDSENDPKNLKWMQHIVVDLGLDDTNRHGEVQTSGGHYARYGTPEKYPTTYAQKNVDPKTDLMVAIKLFSSKSLAWEVISGLLNSTIQEEIYGESMVEGDPISRFAKKVFPTFVHEVVHLEQDGRENNPKFDAEGNYDPKKSWHRTPADITYTPDPSRKRRVAVDYSGTHKGKASRNNGPWASTQPTVRWGKRGNPSRLPNKDVSTAEFIEYLGSAHEIEAHAAGAAARLIGDAVEEMREPWRRRNSASEKQAHLNDAVDYIINDMKSGYYSTGSSLRTYVDYMKSKVDEQLANLSAEDQLPKVNILYRKAWTIFMKKLIKHLLAFKKPVPASQWDFDEEPRKVRPGALPQPERQPNLP